MVLVKKASGKWRMCVDYTNLNKARPKDTHLFPNIDKLVAKLSGYKLLSFTDDYSRHNQIPMDKDDRKHTTFMIEVYMDDMIVKLAKNANIGVIWK